MIDKNCSVMAHICVYALFNFFFLDFRSLPFLWFLFLFPFLQIYLLSFCLLMSDYFCLFVQLNSNELSDFGSSNPDQGWGVQHYVITFVSDLRQVGGFLRVLRFPLQIKLIDTT